MLDRSVGQGEYVARSKHCHRCNPEKIMQDYRVDTKIADIFVRLQQYLIREVNEVDLWQSLDIAADVIWKRLCKITELIPNNGRFCSPMSKFLLLRLGTASPSKKQSPDG